MLTLRLAVLLAERAPGRELVDTGRHVRQIGGVGSDLREAVVPAGGRPRRACKRGFWAGVGPAFLLPWPTRLLLC